MVTLKKLRAESRSLNKCKHVIFNLNCSVWINVVPPDGIPRRCGGFSGESLLDVITRNNIPGIFGKLNMT
jgi:hypothetical protein